MLSNLCKLLLLQLNTLQTDSIEELLTQDGTATTHQGLGFHVTQATTLTQGLECLEKETFDLILITLKLEQESDLNPLLNIRETFPKIPIILLVENEAELMIIRAFQGGADSCISSKNLNSQLLIHEIRLVLERQNYRLRIEQQQQAKRQEQEFEDLEHLGGVSASVTARLYGVVPLRETSPELFAEMSQEYGRLLDLALEQRAYRVEYDTKGQLREMADKLGFLKASPKDIIDLHTKTIKRKTKDVTLAKSQAYIFEGRIMVLELMGYLTSFYRKYYIGLSNINILGSSHPN